MKERSKKALAWADMPYQYTGVQSTTARAGRKWSKNSSP
ncbi:Uncharacterised protein [Bordetella pertussis]|nr:Uncharacterised protein [Bordetella pertussis]